MKLLSLLLVLLCYHKQTKADETVCKGVLVRNVTYEKEILVHVNAQPYQFALDYNTNTLFFSITSPKEDLIFESGFLNLTTKEFNTIDGVSSGFSSTVDYNSHTVYLSGDDGIYTFDYDTKKVKHLQGSNPTNIFHTIWQLFYKNNLYYTTHRENFVFIFKNGYSERVPELINTKALLVAIDNNDDIYFSNSSGLYVHLNNTNSILNLGDYDLECFTTDINGNVYFATSRDIYQINNTKIEHLASMKTIYGMAVDKDGSIIVGQRTTIFRLKPTNKQCIVPEKKHKA